MSKYIPGNPKIVPQNMLGAGGLVAANWLANVAPRDGTAMLAISSNLPVGQAVGLDGVKYDIRKFSYIGNTTDSPNVINSWHIDRRHQDRAGHGEGVRGRRDRAAAAAPTIIRRR